MAEASPVKKLVNLVLLQAIRDKASDIHFEPFEDEFKMRYRIDGVLFEMVPPPKHVAMAISSRIKVMASLDIAERRVPAGRPYRAPRRGPPGRPARQRPADDVRRERRAACSGPDAGEPGPRADRLRDDDTQRGSGSSSRSRTASSS
jgi:hypothetical protein